MNPNVAKIKKTIETFFHNAESCYTEKKTNRERYSFIVAKEMNDKLYSALNVEYCEAREKVSQICEEAIALLIAKDVLSGDEITQDAELLSERYPLELSVHYFEALALKYGGKNNTMCAMLRQYADSKPERYYIVTPQIQAALATSKERADAWKQIEQGALSLIDSINAEYNDRSGLLRSEREKGIVRDHAAQVEAFMTTPISDKLNALVGD